MSDQLHYYTGEFGVIRVARYLANINPLIITETSGTFEEALLGLTVSLGQNRYYIALARTDLGRKITKYEMAGVLFHELTHAADFDCDSIDLDEYREVYERYSHQGTLDPHTGAALGSKVHKTELMARAFQGAFFGPPEPNRTKKEFRHRVSAWRKCSHDLVKLVERDFFRIFSAQRNLQIIRRETVTTTQPILRPIKNREGWRNQRVNWHYRPHKMEHLYRDTLLWLREQALQAENDPNREWDGFQAEWDQLLAGTHPDPHPELIIYGHPVDNFDPTKLKDPTDRLRFLDDICYTIAKTNDPKIKRLNVPPQSQQFYATISRSGIEDLLNHDTETTHKFDSNRRPSS